MILNGKKINGQAVVRRIPIKDIPMQDEKACSAFLHKLYQEKV